MKITNYHKFLCFILIIFTGSLSHAFEEDLNFIEIPSSPNPVGSGAMALGMGGAFIAVADDATAASWNPGGLIQLDRPEFSLVGTGFHRVEDNTFSARPEGSGAQSVSGSSVNYLSIAYPFQFRDYNMIVSVSYQNLYNFSREWNLSFRNDSEKRSENQIIDYQLDGSLSAFGVAYCVRINRYFSMGLTLNFWEDGLEKNEWEDRRFGRSVGVKDGYAFIRETRTFDRYSFSGFNMNFGMLWNMNDKFTVGAVFKTPFEADLKHEHTLEYSVKHPELTGSDYAYSKSFHENANVDMPMSYGIGLAYKFSDNFILSADIYRTEWDDFILTDSDGNETSFVTGHPADESDVDATHQVRVGAEYLIRSEEKSLFWIPLRCGLFYDPAPAQGNPDDFFGFSIGSGITTKRFTFDIAYQYRFGNDVGASILKYWEFSQDIDEHTVYSSIIIYF